MVRKIGLFVILILAMSLNFSDAQDSEMIDTDERFWNKLREMFAGGSSGTESDDRPSAPAGSTGAAGAESAVGLPKESSQDGERQETVKSDLGDIAVEKVIIPRRALKNLREALNGADPVRQDDGGNGICRLPMDRGHCRGYFRRFYYNKESGECTKFVYGGCGGNANRFNTLEECEAKCSSSPEPKTTEKRPINRRCRLPKISGPCTGPSRQYYYYTYTAKCELVFGGCLAGGNRFNSLADCENACVPDSGGSVTRRTKRPPGYGGFGGGGVTVNVRPTNPDCSLPKDRGPCHGYVHSHFFNIATAKCEAFVYGGCGGNVNRFLSLRNCEQTCALKSGTDNIDVDKTEPGDGDKDVNIKIPPTGDSCAPPVTNVDGCLRSFIKYYYNSTKNKCEVVYGACNGYGDIFDDRTQCESTCMPGSLTSTTITPTPVSLPDSKICQLEKDAGPCTATTRKFYFNSESSTCEEFEYGGCLGNENRFDDIFQCFERCGKNVQIRPGVGDEICNLEKDSGPCDASFEMFYFNKNTKKCEEFVYGGCKGNDNRFESLLGCEQKCGQTTTLETSTENNRGTTEVPDVCSLGFDHGPCRVKHIRYFFNKESNKCEEFIYGGCIGNGNRFDTLAECDARCGPKLSSTPLPAPLGLCLLESDPGPCKAAFTYYYFDRRTGRCEQFIYGGCKGNANRFATVDMCKMICEPDVEESTLSVSPPRHTEGTTTPTTSSDTSTATGRQATVLVNQTTKSTLDQSNGESTESVAQSVGGESPSTVSPMSTESVAPTGRTNSGSGSPSLDQSTELPDASRESHTSMEGDRRMTSPLQFTTKSLEMTTGSVASTGRGDRTAAPTTDSPMSTEATTTRGDSITTTKRGSTVSSGQSTESRHPSTESPHGSTESSETTSKTGDLTTASKGEPTGSASQSTDTPDGTAASQTNPTEMSILSTRSSELPVARSTETPNQSTSTVPTVMESTRARVNLRTTRTTAAPVRPNVCSLGPDPGPCEAAHIRYFYHTETNRCVKFLYGGCGGNGNRFTTIEICEVICVSSAGDDEDDTSTYNPSPEPRSSATSLGRGETTAPPKTESAMSREAATVRGHSSTAVTTKGGSTVSPDQSTESRNPSTESLDLESTPAKVNLTLTPTFDLCSMRKDHGPCFGLFKQYYFDKFTGKCRTFMYGGCRGNANRFDTAAECERACIPALPFDDAAILSSTTREVCFLARTSGPCFGYLKRYFYNNRSEKCEEFTYGGCLGNDNRFDTLKKCEERCVIKPTAPPRLKSSPCPVCLEVVPKRIFPLFCAATKAYKTSVRKGATANWPWKIQADLRPAKKMVRGYFTKWYLPKECECHLLENIDSKILILVGKNAQLLEVPGSKDLALIFLNNDITILPLTVDLERTIFEGHKREECIHLTDDSNVSRKT